MSLLKSGQVLLIPWRAGQGRSERRSPKRRTPRLSPTCSQVRKLNRRELRAGSAEPKALADAIRATNIKDNVSPGPGIQFDAKGQNSQLKNSAIQNRGGKLVAVAPKAAANAKPELPMRPYQKR